MMSNYNTWIWEYPLNFKIRLVGVRKTKRATNEERQADMVSHQYLDLLGLG